MAPISYISHFLKILYSPIKQPFLSFLFSLLISPFLDAQTNINGVINSYHAVTEIIYADACVRVDNTSGLNPGDKVVLIQMKGATITTNNNSSFGDTTSLNNAGNYEIAFVCKTGGDSVFLVHNLLNTYTVAGKVQLVKFGEYVSATVVDTLKADPWNNATGKGGVIALSTDQTLTLNAPIYAVSSGYAGGAFLLSNSSCSNFFPANGYAYNGSSTSPQNGAYKGEGVADVAVNVSGGRGAPANGGGGGNNHNNGGGGGANLSAGGAGGGNYTTVSGACTGNYKGLGGKPLSTYGGTKIFMGGGGGAGHVNNNTPLYGGGNGGGIIIIMANDIVGNGFTISANGRDGAGSGSDGASGGGAGGTIIMNVNNSYSGALTVEANGGSGGTANNQNILNRCYGAGGGGSGGAVYFNGSLPAITTSASGGAAGADAGVSGCGTPVPATAGNAGTININYSYRTSTDLSSGCELALPVDLISFTAAARNDIVLLNWEVGTASDVITFIIERLNRNGAWDDLYALRADGSVSYSFTDGQPADGINYYRLKMISRDNRISFSMVRKVRLENNSPYSLYPNPADTYVKINGPLKAGTVVTIREVSGRMIKKEIIPADNTLYTLSLNAVTKGVYLLEVGTTMLKLVKK